MTKTKSIIEVLKNGGGGVDYLAEIPGDRHLLEVPVDCIEIHPDFANALRGKDPADRTLLEASQRETQGPIYPPCVYIELDETSTVHIYMVDGHQRLAAAKANDQVMITVQWVSRWLTTEDAQRDAVDLQYARYEMTEDDVAALIRSGKITQAEIAKKTGYGESKVSRIAKVIAHQWLWTMYRDKAIGLSHAVQLIEASSGNVDKLKSLRDAMTSAYVDALQIVKATRAEMAAAPNKKWRKETRDRAKIETHF